MNYLSVKTSVAIWMKEGEGYTRGKERRREGKRDRERGRRRARGKERERGEGDRGQNVKWREGKRG